MDICEVVDKGKRACARASSSWDKIVQCGVQINVMLQVLILDSQLGCIRREYGTHQPVLKTEEGSTTLEVIWEHKLLM